MMRSEPTLETNKEVYVALYEKTYLDQTSTGEPVKSGFAVHHSMLDSIQWLYM